MAGTVLEKDFWRVALAVYLYGVDVVLRCTAIDHRESEFQLDVPDMDWKSIVDDYHAGQCNLSDAKAFVNAFHQVHRIVADAKRNGQYVSSAWINGRE